MENDAPFTGTPLQWAVTMILLAGIWLLGKWLGDRVRDRIGSEFLSFVTTALTIAVLITGALIIDREFDLNFLIR